MWGVRMWPFWDVGLTEKECGSYARQKELVRRILREFGLVLRENGQNSVEWKMMRDWLLLSSMRSVVEAGQGVKISLCHCLLNPHRTDVLLSKT